MPDLNQAKQGQSETDTSGHRGQPLPGLEDGISIFEILNVLLRRRVLIIGAVVVATGVSVVMALMTPTMYTSSATFLAETSEVGGGGSALALAQQFGVALPGAEGQRTPAFYANLIRSVEVLRRTVTKSYALSQAREGLTEADLVTYYEIEGPTEATRIELARLRLDQAISVGTDRETGVVTLSVTTSDPQLSQEVTQQILDQVHNFDLTTRRTQAGAERQFAEERLAEATTELQDAENDLKSFLIENRIFNSSPALVFEHDRLQRVVIMRQELATSLASSYETARIEEVRNTPVITVIDPPRIPPIRDPKGRFIMLLMGITLGVISGILAAFILNSVEQARERGSADLRDLSSAWKQTLTDLKVLPRRILGRPVR